MWISESLGVKTSRVPGDLRVGGGKGHKDRAYSLLAPSHYVPWAELPTLSELVQPAEGT